MFIQFVLIFTDNSRRWRCVFHMVCSDCRARLSCAGTLRVPSSQCVGLCERTTIHYWTIETWFWSALTHGVINRSRHS